MRRLAANFSIYSLISKRIRLIRRKRGLRRTLYSVLPLPSVLGTWTLATSDWLRRIARLILNNDLDRCLRLCSSSSSDISWHQSESVFGLEFEHKVVHQFQILSPSLYRQGILLLTCLFPLAHPSRPCQAGLKSDSSFSHAWICLHQLLLPHQEGR